MEPARYPSKVDGWLRALLTLVIVVEVGLAAVVLVAPAASGPLAFLIPAACLAVAGFMAWILRGTYYVIGETHLVAHSGPFRFRVPLNSITSLQPSRNPLSSPALSLDRLRIDYQKNGRSHFLLISPKDEDRESFLRDLLAAAPGIRLGETQLATLA